jgi:hypothetical protein
VAAESARLARGSCQACDSRMCLFGKVATGRSRHCPTWVTWAAYTAGEITHVQGGGRIVRKRTRPMGETGRRNLRPVSKDAGPASAQNDERSVTATAGHRPAG